MNSWKTSIAFACCLFALLWTANVQSGEPGSSSSSSSKDEKVEHVAVGKNVTFEKEGGKRRVLIEAEVCLREGPLEQLLTKKQTKEHEAVLAVDTDATNIKTALLLTGAEPGSTVKFGDKVEPAKGPVVRITLRYEEKGKTVTVPAKEWMRGTKGKKLPDFEWVFAGSKLVEGIRPKDPPYFLANDGDVICVSNFESALLDINIASSADNDSLDFEANTDKIPDKGTKVTIILEPVVEKKDNDKKDK
jgi:hypothetical protein